MTNIFFFNFALENNFLILFQKIKNSVKPHFEACTICGQEYCTEPLHSFEEDLLKEPLQEMNSLIQANPNYQMPKSQP